MIIDESWVKKIIRIFYNEFLNVFYEIRFYESFSYERIFWFGREWFIREIFRYNNLMNLSFMLFANDSFLIQIFRSRTIHDGGLASDLYWTNLSKLLSVVNDSGFTKNKAWKSVANDFTWKNFYSVANDSFNELHTCLRIFHFLSSIHSNNSSNWFIKSWKPSRSRMIFHWTNQSVRLW